MNKTVNINLAGVFFYIDEHAYTKLKLYLDAIKKSFNNTEGRDEIISDIEARIAELFTERKNHDNQVISIQEVDEVISVMGQPEDYLVDNDVFEDQNSLNSKTQPKKLFRDGDQSYIGGVAAGLSHYLGIDAIWVRLLWILLSIFSSGYFILFYILFWILVPEAKTTTEKLLMRGEAVNISNIERKIKGGISTVTDTVKNIDYNSHGKTIKTKSRSFFNALTTIFITVIKLFAKFIGLILVFFAAFGLLVLFLGLLSVGVSSLFIPEQMIYAYTIISSEINIWLGTLFIFFAVGIPLFLILYLGLKIIINNLKSIGRVAKTSMFGVWIIAIAGLIIVIAKEKANHSVQAEVSIKEPLSIKTDSVFKIVMQNKSAFKSYNSKGNSTFYIDHYSNFYIDHEADGTKVIYGKDIRLTVQPTTASTASIEIIKEAYGKSFEDAQERADLIKYHFSEAENTLFLDSFWITNIENNYRDQDIEIIIYLPEETLFKLDNNTKSYVNWSRTGNNIVSRSEVNHLLKVKSDKAECLDCTADDGDDDEVEHLKIDINIKDDKTKSKRNTNDTSGTDNENVNINITKNGIHADTDKMKVNIDENGIRIIKKDSTSLN